MDNTKCIKEDNKGMCCCNCRNQVVLHKHPLNKDIGKGEISEVMGYVCIIPMIGQRQGTFFDGKHGMCEMWVSKFS